MSRAPDFVVAIISDFWESNKKILEIGCGAAYLRDDFGLDYIGTDITDEPYNETLPRNVDIVCSAENLKVEDSSIDIVVIKSAFFLFNDFEQALKEIYRVLKPKGILIIFDYNKKTQKELQRKEGHTQYPCWTQWGLKKLLKKNNFKNTTNLLQATKQPSKFSRYYHLLRQEILGTWAIVYGEKG
jgi:ubiquinone/menaquinone biosynthesis C-methylase UbiE